MINSFFNYFFFTSIILIYGVGVEKVLQPKISFTEHSLRSLKIFISTVSTCALSYIFCSNVLYKFDFIEVMPFISVCIFAIISLFVELIYRIVVKKNIADFGLSFIIILIAMTEGFSLGECLFIDCICVISYFAFVPLINGILFRTDLYKTKYDFERTAFILLIVAIFVLSLLVCNVSWLNSEVLK